METLATIITGFSIFVLGQIFLRIVIEPIYQLKKTMANISNTFVCYAHALHNAGKISPELNDEIFKKLRNLSGQLYEDLALMPKRLYKNKYLRKFFFLPDEKKVYEGAQDLIGITNWMGVAKHIDTYKEVVIAMQTTCEKLDLYIILNPRDQADSNL